jgi:sn-glycerol 3-phosphate transport system permease protein
MNAKVWRARLVLWLACFLLLLPLVYQLGLSLKPSSQIFSQALLPLPLTPSLEHYIGVLNRIPFFGYLLNSLLFSGAVTLGQLLLAIPAAFAFSFGRFRGQPIMFALILVSMMIPFVVTYIPNYLTIASWNLIGTHLGMILPFLGSGYAVFLMRQHFKSFPSSVLEAAIVDGASQAQVLWRVLVPANLAAIVALAVYLFIQSWNQLIWPMLIASKPEVYTLTVGVQRFAGGEGGNDWGAMMAASVLTNLPTIVLFLLVRKALLSTFSEGALKG